ncbi:hypothetical protein [Paraconexibacter algicola]|nr:hypothetical protein [Paraconexibacter algicola]
MIDLVLLTASVAVPVKVEMPSLSWAAVYSKSLALGAVGHGAVVGPLGR